MKDEFFGDVQPESGMPGGWGVFDAANVDRRVQAFNRMTADAFARVEPVYRKTVEAARAERAQWAGRLKAADANWITANTARGTLKLRAFTHDAPRGVYLHLHGGGWVLGGADQQDELLAHVRENAGVTVLSLEYRLAPEDPFPAGADDAEAALRWLLDNAPSICGTDRVVIGGESAGANLSVVALTRLRGHPRFDRICGACLNYGTFDLGGTPSLRESNADTPFLDQALSRWYADHYTSPERQRDPEVSPLYADVSGLPHAQFLVGSADAIRDDTLFMYTRWRAAGSPADLVVLPGGLHGLLELKTPLTRPGRQKLTDYLGRRLS